ncbi:MAG: apolipoprotein N-acyltransferase [Rhizobiaceae bacterium]
MERLAGKIMLLGGWRRSALAFLAGAFAVLAQAPFDFFAACFVSFPVLVWLLDGTAGEPGAGILRRFSPVFGTGWWFGFGYFIAGLWWIGNAVLVDGEGFEWALPFAVVALPAVLAIFYGLAAVLARLLWTDDLGRIAAVAFAFGVAEWLRATLFTGFPWNAIGYAAMPVPLLMQSVSMVGLFGMSALAVFVFSVPALFAGRRHRATGIVLALVLVAADLGYGYFCLSMPAPVSAKSLRVRIVQPVIDQTEKWDKTVRDRIFKHLIDLTQAPPAKGAGKPDVIVWPETAVPFLFTERPDALTKIGEVLDKGQLLLTGAVRAETGAGAAPRFYNSILAIDGSGEITDAVDKLHLVPFGEYVPFQAVLGRLGVDKLVELPGTFAAGSERHPIILPNGAGALPFICYEIIFPGEGGREAARSDLIVNVTNDAWFGNTPGPYQHFRQAEVRAVELGLPLIRAANNGISAVVDAHGRVLDALAINAVGALDVDFRLDRGRNPRVGTPSENGLLIIILFGLSAAAMKLTSRGRHN